MAEGSETPFRRWRHLRRNLPSEGPVSGAPDNEPCNQLESCTRGTVWLAPAPPCRCAAGLRTQHWLHRALSEPASTDSTDHPTLEKSGTRLGRFLGNRTRPARGGLLQTELRHCPDGCHSQRLVRPDRGGGAGALQLRR